MIIMILAGLSSIPESFYELARLDNMSQWKVFWRITLPKIKFTLTLAMLIRAMDLLKYFDPVYAITKGGPRVPPKLSAFSYTGSGSERSRWGTPRQGRCSCG
jgi:ABC-type sugar transport system permease subunit